MPEKIYWFQTKSTGQNFEIYWSDLSDLSHVWVCQEDSCGLVVHNIVLVDVSYTKEDCVLVCGKHISLKNPSLGGDFHHKVGRSVVMHRLGSGTGSGCKYRELVSEVWQGAVLNLFLPRMLRTV